LEVDSKEKPPTFVLVWDPGPSKNEKQDQSVKQSSQEVRSLSAEEHLIYPEQTSLNNMFNENVQHFL
jgi:hypothetical protein